MAAVFLRVDLLGWTRSSPLRLGHAVQPDGMGDRENRQARAAALEAQDRRSPPDHVRQHQAAAEDKLDRKNKRSIAVSGQRPRFSGPVMDPGSRVF